MSGILKVRYNNDIPMGCPLIGASVRGL